MRAEPRGFSLLEVLVALVVVALAMAALVRTAGHEAASLAEVRERTEAQWIASNLIAELRLAEAAPPVGLREGRLAFGGRDWRWRTEVADTGVGGIRRIDVHLAADPRHEPAPVLTGFARAR